MKTVHPSVVSVYVAEGFKSHLRCDDRPVCGAWGEFMYRVSCIEDAPEANLCGHCAEWLKRRNIAYTDLFLKPTGAPQDLIKCEVYWPGEKKRLKSLLPKDVHFVVVEGDFSGGGLTNPAVFGSDVYTEQEARDTAEALMVDSAFEEKVAIYRLVPHAILHPIRWEDE